MYFFSQEKFQIHSLTQIQKPGKKMQHWKKKYNIFTHSLDFWPKMAKVKLFPRNKKIRYLCQHVLIFKFLTTTPNLISNL